MSQHSLHDDVVAWDSASEPAAASRDSSHSGHVGLSGGSSHQPDAVITVFAPPATECAGANTWENAVLAFEHRFSKRYGNRVTFATSHLFSTEFFQNPAVTNAVQQGAQAPIITLNGQVIQSGGKLSERRIREELEKLGILPTA